MLKHYIQEYEGSIWAQEAPSWVGIVMVIVILSLLVLVIYVGWKIGFIHVPVRQIIVAWLLKNVLEFILAAIFLATMWFILFVLPMQVVTFFARRKKYDNDNL